MSQSRKIFIARVLIVITFLSIGSRLYYLQIIKGEYYGLRSESNFIQEVHLNHTRGLIFDRNGVPLVDNRPARDIYVTFAMLPNAKIVVRRLAEELGLSKKQIKKFAGQFVLVNNENRSNFQYEMRQISERRECLVHNEKVHLSDFEGVSIRWQEKTGCELDISLNHFYSEDLIFDKLRDMIGVDRVKMQSLVESAQKRAKGLGRFKPVLLIPDIGFEAYAKIEAAVGIGELPGISVLSSQKRRYIHGKFASHILGFMNEVSLNEVRASKGIYRPGDRIGRRGVEAVYEEELRGADGMELFVVDAKGRRLREGLRLDLLGHGSAVDTVPGHNLILSIDFDLQHKAESFFSGRAGSVIAMDPNSGFIIVMASFPAFDSNQIIAKENTEILKLLSKNPLRPWINKATQEHYAPGSTFKVFTAMSGLTHGLFQQSSLHFCSGEFKLKRTRWRCFRRHGHGWVDILEALKSSCDVFFYQLGHDVGIDRLAQTTRLFGFGRITGIDLDNEIPGIVPDKQYYFDRLGYYAPGSVVNMAIGQGDLAITPLQLAVAYSAIVNGGKIFRPRVVKRIVDNKGVTLSENKPFLIAQLDEESPHLEVVKKGISGVTKKGGTAYGLRFRSDLPNLSQWLKTTNIEIGGKTGTAQVVRLSKQIGHLKPEEVPYEERDHAWFVGFAPIEDPEIVVVAMIEHGGFGGTSSAPVAARIIQSWHENKNKHSEYVSNQVAR